jgi:diguanylate cyclase (GGDEF)-like protein
MTLSALLFIDLDGFKEVNDFQGHEIGDQLLIELSNRMQKLASRKNRVFRLGGDEFVILFRCPDKILMTQFKQRLHDYIEQLLHIVNTPMTVDGHNLLVSASIGVAIIPQDGRTSSEVLSHADSAMYQAKRGGKNCYRYFDSNMQAIEDRQKQMAREIQEAIINNEFQLYYQLQIDSKSKEIYGMEALIRWPHPTTNALISPSEFIQVAVEANHIQSIDEWVIEQATRDIAELQKFTNRSIPVSINLSAKTLENPKLPKKIIQQIEKHHLAPADLRLEVTETSLLNNLDRAIDSLNILRHRGIQTSIDDFGTGYSSLSYLQTLPIDTLKIDKSFIDKIATSQSDVQICRSIIQLAVSLDKKIIAEGVQSEIQQQILENEGCHIIQGYLYAEPQPFTEIIQLLTTKSKQSQALIDVKSSPSNGQLKIVSHL